MRNLAFVIWMVGMPIANAFDAYIFKYLLKYVYSDTVTGVAALISFAIYFWVGFLLYEKKK